MYAMILGLLGLPVLSSWGQQLPVYQYPIPESIGLSGTFGEPRGSHFHHGIDIRTGERIGLPIRVAEDGYVSRVRVSYSGYGKAIYVQHPDGRLTMYGHCDGFMPEIEAEVQRLQQQNRQFDVEIFPTPDKYPVKKGQTIAYSGNTGASEGPHLHYEVRDKEENILNPQAYHPEVRALRDELSPVLNAVAFEPLMPESRVEGRWEKFIVTLTGKTKDYRREDVIGVYGKVGVEFEGFDRSNGSAGRNGVYSATLLLDGQQVFQMRADRFSFNDLRQVLQFVDYGHWLKTRTRFVKCYQDEGLTVSLFYGVVNRGVIDLTDNAIHEVKVVLADFHGNTTSASFRVQNRGDELVREVPVGKTGSIVQPSFYLRHGRLVLRGGLPPKAEDAYVRLKLANGVEEKVAFTYASEGAAYAVVALSPDRVPVRAEAPFWPKPLDLGYDAVVLPEAETVLDKWQGMQAVFPQGSVFEATAVDVQVRPSETGRILSDIYTIGDGRLPLNKAYKLTLTATGDLKAFRPEQVVLAQMLGPGRYTRMGSEYRVGNTFTASASNFGTYCLVADLAGPTVRNLNFRAGHFVAAPYLKLLMTDDIAGVHPFKLEVTLDGQWVAPEYYNYQNTLYVRLKGLKPGKHTLAVRAVDYAGNVTTKTYPFLTR